MVSEIKTYLQGKGLRKYVDLIWILLITTQWCSSNYIDLIGDDKLVQRLYFLLNSVSVLIVLLVYIPKKWYVWAFVEIAVYWVFDEIQNEGDIYRWYELPLMIVVLASNYLYYKFKK